MRKMIVLLILIVLLGACQPKDELKEKIYDGEALRVAVIGDVPKVREDQVNFEKVSWKEMAELTVSEYDAVIVMEDHLPEAAAKKNKEIYKKINIPFFFVGSKASHVPFTSEDNSLSYKEHAERINDDENFISGILYKSKKEGFNGWKFSYPIENNKFQKDKVKGIYSAVFKVVEAESL
ncbi:hypothetical protein VBD025_14420 [Virgibacillus flavescens]|uniref:hypothetical protein n=1 Tax=Virgibacillus flavescens TaxID=1611422 RepID=UPI003D32B681